jgi:hypothetical protein
VRSEDEVAARGERQSDRVGVSGPTPPGGMTVLTDEQVLAQAPHADRARTRIPWRRLAAEVFVIMGSILAAFAVDRWWESRSDERQAAVLLRALAEDFAVAARDLQAAKLGHVTVSQANKQLIDFGEAGRILTTNSAVVDTLVGRNFWRPMFEPPLGTLSSLIASGRLELIGNNTLVAELTRWSAAVDLLKAREREARDHFYQRIYPYLLPRLDLEDVDKGYGAHIDFPWHQQPADARAVVLERSSRA